MLQSPRETTPAGGTLQAEVARRLKWRARRGMLENDLLLERFFEQWEGRLTESDHSGLAQLLDLSDNDLLNLLVGTESPSGGLDCPEVHAVLEKIRTDPS